MRLRVNQMLPHRKEINTCRYTLPEQQASSFFFPYNDAKDKKKLGFASKNLYIDRPIAKTVQKSPK